MKVLWVIPYANLNLSGKVQGGGWITALAHKIVERDDIELAIAEPSLLASPNKKDVEGIVLYSTPVVVKVRFGKILPYRYSYKRNMEFCRRMLSAVDDFKPDIIHIWGSESGFGLVAKMTNIPCVLHIQGIINAYNNVYFPPNVSLCRVFWSMVSQSPLRGALRFYRHIYRGYKYFGFHAELEKEIFKCVRNYMGRTEWDKNVTSVLSPNAHYFYVSEMLRDEIMNSEKWKYHSKRRKLVISSIVRNDLYKGHDVIMRAAKHLKKLYGDFEWNIYGNTPINVQEALVGIKAAEVNVHCRGSVCTDELVRALLDSDVFCHPSYVENSSNAICEAQMLGVPVVATDGGGTATMLKDGAGILIPTCDDYQMAANILRVKNERQLSESISKREIALAEVRHNPDTIVSDVVNAYRDIVERTSNR